MNAKEFFENQSITDANRSIIDKNKHKFNRFDVVNFAESYYQYKTKQNNKPMKTQIKNLHELAKLYVARYSKDEYLNSGTYLQDVGFKIMLYFAEDFDTWTIEYDKVNIRSYMNSIELPIDADTEYLKDTYRQAKLFYDKNLKP